MGVVLLLISAIGCCTVSLTAADEDSNTLSTNSRYECGIRKRFGISLIHNTHSAELGQWPWHAALFYDNKYICGGTLIDQHHVLTSAHCVVDKSKGKLPAEKLKVHLGKIDLNETSDHVRIMSVSEIHVHEAFETNVNDIALLVMSSVVQYSNHIIPICIESIQTARADDLAGRTGWVAGWGETEEKKLSNQLKTAQMPVVNNTVCVLSDKNFYSNFISNYVFCAGFRNGTSLCRGDSGGGLYILEGDQWELRGIPSFAASKYDSCDTNKFVVFTNVAAYYHWIKQKSGVFVKENDHKRISARKCLQYRRLARKKNNGVCLNARSPHTVAIIDRNQLHISSGVIISEKFILTKAPNLIDIFEISADWDELKIRIGNQQDNEILREISHPDYDQDTYGNHIMLLELKMPLIFTEALIPACLANEASENLYDSLILNGYTGYNETANVFYENIANKIIPNEQCNKSVQANSSNQYTLFKEEICTRFTSNATFTWKGIVGGPLQTFNTRSCVFTVIGITKFLIPVNETQYTNVFSRVTNYLKWIENVVWGNENTTEEFEMTYPVDFEPPIVELPSNLTSAGQIATTINPTFESIEQPLTNMKQNPVKSGYQMIYPNVIMLVMVLAISGLYHKHK